MWKLIEGYDHYMVNELGQVLGLKRNKILKPALNSKGYLTVRLYQDGKGCSKSVHRLVACAFLPNPDNLPQVNHKDEDRTNACLDNLEWCDAQYNSAYSKAKAWRFTSPDGELVEIENLNKFCKEHSLHSGHMTWVHMGKYNSHKGWTAA